VYVSGFINDRIQKFDSSGTFLEMWGYGVDDGTNAFQICTKDTTPCQDGIIGTADGQFFSSLGIEVDSADNVYVGDGGGNFRIQKFDSSGTFLTSLGSFGIAEGQFSTPVDIAIDSADNVYVSDQGNNRIQKFAETPEGQTQNVIDKLGTIDQPKADDAISKLDTAKDELAKESNF